MSKPRPAYASDATYEAPAYPLYDDPESWDPWKDRTEKAMARTLRGGTKGYEKDSTFLLSQLTQATRDIYKVKDTRDKVRRERDEALDEVQALKKARKKRETYISVQELCTKSFNRKEIEVLTKEKEDMRDELNHLKLRSQVGVFKQRLPEVTPIKKRPLHKCKSEDEMEQIWMEYLGTKVITNRSVYYHDDTYWEFNENTGYYERMSSF